jgi:hypothetical protein
MTSPDVIYWDWFTNEYCLEKDDISPPERYTAVYGSCDGMFVEKWEVTENSEGNRLSIAFTEEEHRGDLLKDIRQCQFDKHNCRPIRLIGFDMPQRLFEKRVEALLERKDNEAS